MAKPSPLTWTPLFDRALNEEIGIAFTIHGTNRDDFRRELYRTRIESGDPRYQDLILFAPAAPHENEVWICKKQVSLDDASP
jgi:hypothetical protein